MLKESESIIPVDLPSSNYSLVEKVVTEIGKPAVSERKITEVKRSSKEGLPWWRSG